MWTYAIPAMLGVTLVVLYVLRAFISIHIWVKVVIRSTTGFGEALLETGRIHAACACEGRGRLANPQSE
jgi:hypothetical protein